MMFQAAAGAGGRSTWREFLAEDTVMATRDGDYPAWRRGRDRYAAWVIPIDEPAVAERLGEVRRALAGRLLEPCHRAPHVTLFACGFPTARPRYDDDINPGVLEGQGEALRSFGTESFEFHVGGACSFLGAPYLVVDDSAGGIERVRRILARTGREQRFAAFVPHVTVGVYNAPWGTADIAAVLGPFGRLPRLRLHVTCIELVSFDARHPAGPLHTQTRVVLGAGESCGSSRS